MSSRSTICSGRGTPSLRWLIYLARRIEGQGVCVIATIRPVGEESPLLAELLVDPGTAVLP